MRGTAVSVVLLAVLASALLPPSRAADLEPPTALDAPFSPNVRVNSGNPTYLYQVEPTMAINSQGRIFVGWKEAFTHDGGGQRVSFSYSADDGASWAPNILMPLNRTTRQSDPWLSITDDDRVFFTRLEFNSAFTVSGITVSNTTDGIAWGTPFYYSDSPMFADKETAAHGAAGNLYWAWNTDNRMSGVQDIVVTRSDDGGRTWTSEASVPDPGDGVIGAFVRVHPDGTVLLVWWSYFTDDVWFDRSFDGGATWGTDIRVNDVPGSAGGYDGSDWIIPLPAMAVAPNGTVYVVWPDHRGGNHDIMFSRSMDRGTTWSPTIRLNDDSTLADQWMPDLAVDPSGGVHVAWMDTRNGQNDVYYVNSSDGGATWGANVRVTDAGTPLNFWRPGDYLAIESDGSGGIHVVWTDGRLGNLDIFYAKLGRTTSVTVDTIPPGLTVEVDGVPATAPYAFVCENGRTYTIAAPTPQGGSPTRYTFSSWSDGGAQTHQFLCASSATYTATFLVEHEVTLATSPPNLDIVLDGVPYATPWTSWWPEGSSGTVDAPSPQGGGSTRYLFDSWSDTGAQAHLIVASGPMTLVAAFRTQFLLLVQSPYGAVSCDSPDCWYAPNAPALFSVSPLIVDASPGTRYAFAGWLGDSNATSGSASIAMDAPHVVTADWVIQFELTVDSPYGTTVGAGWYNATSDATFSVSPQTVAGAPGARYVFDGWTRDSNATSASSTLIMDGPRSVNAVWGTEYELQAVSPHGTTAGAGWYRANTDALFSVSPGMVDGPPGTRYAFQRWTGDSTVSNAAASIRMDEPRTVAAAWGTEYELTIVSEYGIPVGDGWYAEGAVVDVSIEVEVTVDGTTYRFAGWTGDDASTNATFGTAMTGPKRIVALWVEVPRTQTGQGLPVLDWWTWFIALAVIFMLIVLFAWRRRRKEDKPPPPPNE